MPPFDEDALNDDFQDARVIKTGDDYVEVEVIHYPLGTAGQSIGYHRDWRTDYAGMTEFLDAGVRTNWDAKMRRDVYAELKARGIDIDKLADKEVVEKVSTWAMRRGRHLSKVFTTYYFHYPDGRPAIYPGLEKAFDAEFARDSRNYDWTKDEHLEHELFGRGMYYNKTYGSCTSFAVYLTTVLRAVGIPARMVIGVSVVDPSDPHQRRLLRKGLTHHRIRYEVLRGVSNAGWRFTAHTFHEVYVGGHWHRLNYNELGEPIVDEHCFGLVTHLYTFADLSEIELAATWGCCYAHGQRSEEFSCSNPYKAVTVTDLFGAHAHVDNPEATRPPKKRARPNIVIMHPRGLSFSAYEEISHRVKDRVWARTGRYHDELSYEEVFDVSWDLYPGDVVVLLFSLDTKERIPAGYKDLLPKSWSEIEAILGGGGSVELAGKARELRVILLASPTQDQLKGLIRQTNAPKPGRNAVELKPPGGDAWLGSRDVKRTC
jgi:hypothetical protein